MLVETGVVVSSIAAFLVAGVCVMLRAERKGVERFFGNEIVVVVVYKILILASVSLLIPLGEPLVGIYLVAAVVLYTFWYEGYAEIHLASVKMAALFGFL